MTTRELADYLSYSGRRTYKICPAKYDLGYVQRVRVIRDDRNTYLGTTVGKVFEWFYSRSFWKSSDVIQTCLDSVDEAIEDTFRDKKFDPSTDSSVRPALELQTKALIPTGVEIIRSNGFLTPLSRAEIDLTTSASSEKHGNITVKLGGRADFIHGTGKNDLWILDGKASKHREKYVDPEQLIWYGVQHYVKYHVFPTRLGFIFWSIPSDPVSWIDFTPNDFRRSVDETFEIVKKIRLRQFDPTPSSECYRCDYKDQCEAGKRWIQNRRLENGGRIESSTFDPEIVT